MGLKAKFEIQGFCKDSQGLDSINCDPRVIIERMIIERRIIDVYVIESSFYRIVLLSNMHCYRSTKTLSNYGSPDLPLDLMLYIYGCLKNEKFSKSELHYYQSPQSMSYY